jgi:hypothetical protein
MRSNKSMVLLSFGVLFLSFGSLFLILGLLGLHFGSRESLGGAGILALAFLLIGAALYGGGMAIGKRSDGTR